MTSRLLCFLLTLLVATEAGAQCTGANLLDAMPPGERARLDAAVAAEPYPEGILWRAEKAGSTVHVLGTVHLPDPRLDEVASRIGPILDDADLLILEATTDMQADMQRIMVERPEIAFLTEGPTLIDLLGEEVWTKVSEELSARGVPPFFAAKFRPWLLSMTLAVPQCAVDAIAGGSPGLDARLEAMAETAGIPIATLDDVEAVLALLSDGTLEEQVDMLRASLMIEQDQTAAMATLLDSYFAGRHREFWEFSRHLAEEAGLDPGAFDAMEQGLLIERNRDWATDLPGLIDRRAVVLAVGAAHLSGETGTLRTLERLGYRLTRL